MARTRERTGRLLLIVASLLAACSLAASCGETNIAAIERLRPNGQSVRERLGRVAARLPPPGTVSVPAPPASPFVPPLVLNFRKRQVNADVLMFEQLQRPEVDLSGGLDLMLSPELLSCLLWTGPENPLDQSVWDDRTELGRDCERAFATRWLVVARTVAWQLPERVALEVFVVDLAHERLMASFPVELAGRLSGDSSPVASRQLASDAFVVARCEVVRRLGTMPGAYVTLDDGWPTDGARDPCAGGGPQSFRPVLRPKVAKQIVAAPPADGPRPGQHGLFETCSGPADAGAPRSLREVDWCNREMVPNVLGLLAGRSEMHDYLEPGGIHDTLLGWLRNVEYADFDSDGAEDALVVVDTQSYVGAEQHSSTGTWLGVWTWRAGAPALVASETLPFVREIEVEGAEIRTRGDEGGRECARVYRVSTNRIEQRPDAASCNPVR